MSQFKPETIRGDLIGGSFRKARTSDGVITRKSPSDQDDLLGEFPFRVASVQEAIEAARKAQASWAKTSWSSRRGVVLDIQSEIKKRADDFAKLLQREVGKPAWEAKSEVQAMMAKCESTIRLSEEEQKSLLQQGSKLRLRPLGVIAVLGQSTFPGHLSNSHLLPALLSGNTIVLKPSELTPATGQLLAEIYLGAGLPKGVINVIQGDASIGAALAAHPQIDGIFFTGTYATGRKILEATLDQPWKLTALQMGGKCAAILDADVDILSAARECVFSAYVTAGQRCTATSRIFVHKKISDALIEKFSLLAKGLRVGYPFDNDTFMGPMVSFEARERFLSLVDKGVSDGAERLFGAEAVERSRDGAYVRPGAHRVKKDLASPYLQEELLGPDVAFCVFSDLDEALALANQSEYGLALSYFGKKEANFEEVCQRGRAGLIHWNRGTVSASGEMPFGGIGKSGNFRPAGAWSLRHSSFPVASLEGSLLADPQRWPPGFGREGR